MESRSGWLLARVALVGVLAIGVELAALPARGQSLVDVARQEDARRKGIKRPAKVYTNASLHPAPESSLPAAGSVPAASSAQPAPVAGAATDPAGPARPAVQPAVGPPVPARDEASWRKRITDLRTTHERNAVLLDSLQSRINALWADFTARDDPAQRAVLAQDRQRALAELDRLKKEQAALTKQIADVEEEARRANVPPGWLR